MPQPPRQHHRPNVAASGSRTADRRGVKATPGPAGAASCGAGLRRRQLAIAAGAAGIMVLGTLLTADLVRYHKWSISTNNSNAAEGLAWAKGRLEIRKASPDTVKVDGRIYNVFPPLFSAVSATVLWCAHVFAGKYVFPPWLYVGILLAPLLASAFWALYTCTGSVWKTVVLILGYWVGTSLLPVLVLCRPGAVWHVNQVLSQIGLFLIVGDCLGRRCGWPSLIGLVIAAWSRQLTLLYVLPISLLFPRRKGPLIAAAVTLAGILLLPMALNAMKFGSPFESGYRLMYADPSDALAQRAQRGLFGLSFLRDNLWAMNAHFPGMHLSSSGLVLKTNGWGSSMWLGTPLLLYVLIAGLESTGAHARHAAGDRRAAALPQHGLLPAGLLPFQPGFPAHLARGNRTVRLGPRANAAAHHHAGLERSLLPRRRCTDG